MIVYKLDIHDIVQLTMILHQVIKQCKPFNKLLIQALLQFEGTHNL